MSVLKFEKLFEINARTRWIIIVFSFGLIALLDLLTPSEYVMAYLYAIPILAILATLLNTVVPPVALNSPSVVVNRLLATLSILISAFFTIRI